MKLINWFFNLFKKSPGFDPKLQDERDDHFQLGGALFGYTPKHVRKINLKDWQKIRNQTLNTCVLEAIGLHKEPQENIDLGSRGITAYLRSKGQMSNRGTSLSYAQKALRDFGITEEKVLPSDRSLNYNQYSDPSILTKEIKDNAAKHKSASYWKTFSLFRVLEEIDNDNNAIGHTAAMWYSGYNIWSVKGLKAIIKILWGYIIGGHSFCIMGYDMDYLGKQVLIIANSFGEEYGDSGLFYIEFKDFKIFEWGVYFSEDIAKDILGWLALHQRRAVKEIHSPKIWYIEGKKKRWIPDEAILLMLGFNFYEFEGGRNIDDDDYLKDVEEGEPIKFEEIPLDVRRAWQEIINSFPYLKDRFAKYY